MDEKQVKEETYWIEGFLILVIVGIILAGWGWLELDLSFLSEYKGFYLINAGNEVIKFMT